MAESPEQKEEVKEPHIPQVAARGRNWSTVAIVTVIVVAAMIVIGLPGGEETKQPEATEEREFGTGAPRIEVRPEPTPEPEVELTAEEIAEDEVVERLMLEAAYAPPFEDEERARRRAPLIAFKDGREASRPAVGSPGEPSPRVEDPVLEALSNPDRRTANERFFDSRSQESVMTVNAKRLPDGEFLIYQGKVIPAVLETAMVSDMPGGVRAIVSRDIYGESGRRVLIPRSSRLIGVYNSKLTTGQTRIFVIWTRLIRPDGIDIALGSPGTDQLGRGGFGGWVDTHFWERFGTAALLSVMGAAVSLGGVDSDTRDNSASRFREGITGAFQGTAEATLSDTLQIPPTIGKDQGDLVNVFVARDLNFARALEDDVD